MGAAHDVGKLQVRSGMRKFELPAWFENLSDLQNRACH